MKRANRAGAMIIVALGLSACGTLPKPGAPLVTAQPTGRARSPLQTLIDGHTRCPSTYFLSPIWTPDGASILYDSGPAIIDIHMMRIDPAAGAASDDRVLVGDAVLLAVSPDGKTLLYSRRGKANSPNRDLYLLDLESSQSRLIVQGGNRGSWSPDSARIAHEAGTRASGPIGITDAAGGQTSPLTADLPGVTFKDSAPQWSPGPVAAEDEEWIAFDSNRAGTDSVAIASVDAGEPVPIAPPDDGRCDASLGEVDSLLGWRPDPGSTGSGGEVAVARICGGVNIGVSLFDTAGERTADWPDVRADSLEWSPDGRRLLFVSHDGKTEQLNVAQADGSEPRVLRVNARDAHWSPGDGTRIVFTGRDAQTGAQDIYLINADGSGERRLTSNPAVAGVCLH